ncbi:hypothetical protein [Streptomyces sodiiphilus]|uniref:hypothetical protein n=1 Tax=Streptomyces sodiiphilus TaxID=226217 RepID=UPI0031D77A14
MAAVLLGGVRYRPRQARAAGRRARRRTVHVRPYGFASPVPLSSGRLTAGPGAPGARTEAVPPQTPGPEAEPGPGPVAGIRCVCLAYVPEDGSAFRLGVHAPDSAWGAMLWLSWRAAHIADQLDPDPARAVRGWLADGGELDRGLGLLETGSPYFLFIDDGAVHYVLSASPAPKSPFRSGPPLR